MQYKKVCFVLAQIVVVFFILIALKVDRCLWPEENRSSSHRKEIRTRHKRKHYAQQNAHINIKEVASSDFDVACNMEIVETLPSVLLEKGFAKEMDIPHLSIHKAWLSLIDKAHKDFAVVSQWGIGKKGKGLEFYNHLKDAIKERHVKLRIVHTYKYKKSSKHSPYDLINDAPELVQAREPSITGKTSPPWKYGIIHSKVMVADSQHFYMGSANLGSRGTSWTKELGMMVTNCPKLGEDARKIFDLYWSIDGLDKLPTKYPKGMATEINDKNPLQVLNHNDGVIYNVYMGSSPPTLCADGRTDDLTSILHVIKNAQKYIYIAVNEYIPMDLWKNKKPWTVIDDQIREAVTKRKVTVKFLVNSRASHKSYMLNHFKDLIAVDPERIEVRIYTAGIKGFQGSHNKIMVTEKAAFIGTSNWTEDYFTTTAGVTFVFEPVKRVASNSTNIDLRLQMEQVFFRDFNSELALPFTGF